MTPPSTRLGKMLYFLNLLGDTTPLCLDWTKIGLAMSTAFAAITGVVATVQQVVGSVAHTDWTLFAAAIGLHGVSHGAARVRSALEK